jgi:hypothetical protein
MVKKINKIKIRKIMKSLKKLMKIILKIKKIKKIFFNNPIIIHNPLKNIGKIPSKALAKDSLLNKALNMKKKIKALPHNLIITQEIIFPKNKTLPRNKIK